MISLDNLTVSYGGWTLFDNISFLINPKDRIGLVGKNGAGKTTLLKLIVGEQQPTSGAVSKNGECTVGYLPQQMKVADTTTLVEETASAFKEVLALEAEIAALTREIAERTDYESPAYEALLHRLNDAQDHYHILGGETRDAETASISVRAAITGHMVFSTLHTNDALSSIVRLEDMGVERYMIANSVAGLVAQRLMRRVCPHCAKQMPVTAEERTYLGPDIPFVRRGTGCTQCNGTGYRGRIAIHELVIINRELRELISAGATQAQLTEAARRSQGMTSLREAALQLVREGETTPEELLKITFYEE